MYWRLSIAVNENTVYNVTKLYETVESRICFVLWKYMTDFILKVPVKEFDGSFGVGKIGHIVLHFFLFISLFLWGVGLKLVTEQCVVQS